MTLTGVAGVGKTRLALRVAEDVRRAFPDGVWLVELAALADPGLLVHTVAGALGLPDQAVSPTERLAEYLADKRLLLVLDNCEHLLDACAGLVGALLAAAPELRVLATSRQALRVDGEHVFGVPAMSVPNLDGQWVPADLRSSEAVTLFTERAAAGLPGFRLTEQNELEVATICRRLEGIPLAIELAAVRLQSLSLQQILDRLDNCFMLLTTGSRAALPRQRTLRAMMDWSFELCSAEERTLWARLSVFSGGFDLEAAEEVCSGDGIPREEVLHLVAGLVDKSILTREQHGNRARYRLLETIRQYGRDRLAESGQEKVLRRRHRDYVRALAEQAYADWFSPRQVTWASRMRVEHPNVRAALEFCLSEPGEARAGQRIAASLRSFWIGSGLLTEGRHWLDRALRLDTAPTPERARALWVCSFLDLLLADPEPALRRLAECGPLARKLGDVGSAAYTELWTGYAALHRGDASGLDAMAEALTQLRAAGDEYGTWISLLMMSLGACALGDDRALGWGEEALRVCERHEAKFFGFHSLWMTGLERWRRGECRNATALAGEALRLKRSVNDPWGIAHCLAVLAFAAGDEGQHRRAARLLGAAHAAWRLAGSGRGLWGVHAFDDQCVAGTREVLGEAAFDAAYREGAGFTLEEAIGYALGDKTGDARAAHRPDDARSLLTRREREVADLIARGLSNRQIAETLVIAQRTAESHVEHILAKLGFTSRAQIAAWHTGVTDEAAWPGRDSYSEP
ncbi:ATP-binding protein [Gandjariella thermophila]|uniref:LuxR family transcriptional regulator n=1 Tax=Gandjariella thermophila TaxID=1931992 RepID=A0A4D4J1Z8_9PSEU|nr:LuxR C-terminal-related transcriptional regulator [Gandjariella thermophila]GDY29122.1 LuxR family transcriptional regulator [Gandjariella thermophila]